MGRAPDRDPRREDGRGRRLAWTESKRGPHEPRQRDERQRVMGGLVEQPPPEPDVHADEEREEQQRGFGALAAGPPALRMRAPGDQQWGHEQDPGGVAQPPREPDGPVAGRRRHARQRDRCRADAGAHEAGDQRDGRKREDVLHPGKRADQPVQQSPPQDRFQGVPNPDHRGDGDDGEDVGGMVAEKDHDVRQECSEHDSRPDAIPPQQHGGEGDPCRWPHGRRIRLLKRQQQTQPRRCVVEDRDNQDLDRPTQRRRPRAEPRCTTDAVWQIGTHRSISGPDLIGRDPASILGARRAAGRREKEDWDRASRAGVASDVIFDMEALSSLTERSQPRGFNPYGHRPPGNRG